MKKTVYSMSIAVLVIGLGFSLTTEFSIIKNTGTKRIVEPVINEYLENSLAGSWEKVYATLSGEALAEARVNADRVKTKGKLLKSSIQIKNITDEIVAVTADVTFRYGGEPDRTVYDFQLKKMEDNWKIYKAAYGSYKPERVKQGDAEPEAVAVVKEYIELPFETKRVTAGRYLVGEIKQEALRSAAMTINENNSEVKSNIQSRVKSIKSIGTTKDYALLEVDHEVVIEGETYPRQALVEIVELEGSWKIGSIDISI